MLPSFTNKIWTHKTVVNYADLACIHSYKDITLFGIPANHMIVGVKIVTLASFSAGLLESVPNCVWVYVGNSNVFPTPSENGDNLVTDIHKTYGMNNLTIPAGGGDEYEYGSFYWFSISAPGTATFARNHIPGFPSVLGSYCLPQRMDAHDIIARFCILDSEDTPARPEVEDDEWTFNADVTTGDAEITVSYMVI